MDIPKFELLERAGIVGAVTITDCVQSSASPCFFGPYGFKLQDAVKVPFTPYMGRWVFLKLLRRRFDHRLKPKVGRMFGSLLHQTGRLPDILRGRLPAD
jgi:hypothetical protein